MNILSIDTASNKLSLSLKKKDKRIVNLNSKKDLNHLTTLVPSIKKILEKNYLKLNEIDYFAVNIGPGSYTGLRIGITTIRTLSQILKTKIISVDNIMALCVRHKDKYVLVKNNARANEIYAGLYYYDSTKNKILTIIDTGVFKNEDFEKILKKVLSENKDIKNNLITLEETYPNAKEILEASLIFIKEKKVNSYSKVHPKYLKASEAERNFKKKI